MNYFEFKQQLLIDSFTKDEEFHRMRKEDLRCARAYKDAMEFEKILNNALKIKAPDNLKDSIILRQSTNHSVKKPYRHYAIAASFFVSLIILSIFWNNRKPISVEGFITESMLAETNLPMTSEPMSFDEVKEVFAHYNTQIVGDIGKVHFIHDCHTPGGIGVHMVVITDTGPVTVYYMPKTELDKDRINFDIEDTKAVLVAMQKGSVAIIADTQQQLASIEPMLQNNLQFL